MSIWLTLDTRKCEKNSDKVESLARRPKIFHIGCKGSLCICFAFTGSRFYRPSSNVIGWTTSRDVEGKFKSRHRSWLQFLYPRNLEGAFFAAKIDRIQKGWCLRNNHACHYTEPTAGVVSGSPVYLTWRLKFLKYDWPMSVSTFQRCVLSRCENEQTQRVEHLIKDLHSCGITIKPWPVSQLERHFDLLTERYLFFVKGARIHVTVRQFDKCAFH